MNRLTEDLGAARKASAPISEATELETAKDELAVAAILAERYRPDHAYRPGHGWHARTKGGPWLPDQHANILAERLRHDCARVLVMHRNSQLQGVRALLEIALYGGDWTQPPTIAGIPSGSVDLATCAVTSPAPETPRLTRHLGADPNFKRPPERWLRVLDETLPADMVGWFQRWCGYCITGHTREHKFVMAHGSGGNGKSIVLGTVVEAAGSYHRGIPASALAGGVGMEQHPEWLARVGSDTRLVTAIELPERGHWRVDLLKAITAGDVLTARFMRQESFDFLPHCKLMVAANHKPQVANVDRAIRRRLVLVPFENVFDGASADRMLSTTLAAELPSIVAWVIEGARAYIEGGLGDLPESAFRASTDYMAEQDRFGRWFEECLIPGADSFVATTELLDSYNEFADAHMAKPTPIIEYLTGERGLQAKQKRIRKDCNAVRGVLGAALKWKP